ncbi:PLP-dependent aminotransferase family protein [Shewanella sp. KX20019]|uniref:aminotransferase-like domain-containing protein n=1 Tax=Shewanella sp. KX20019 TaxID=2803864 RepID=UPI001926087E|nr:PLP-dependent aminotransferase family protein [Shewanella sp. KX20019]QQX78605.1 PLP-dependent aminotransferase family protein [Shewanella sp. KX20019]
MGTIWVPTLENYKGPLYVRLAEAAEDAINSELLLANSKLPPQRQLADIVGVTIGTVTRAYALLEQRGYVFAKVGAGTFVKGREVQSKSQAANFATCEQPLTNQTSIISDALSQLAKEPHNISQLMQYHADPLPQHQLKFSQWLHGRQIPQTCDQIVFSHGAQQGIFAVLNGLMNAGETLLCEDNCYPGIKVAAQQLSLNIEKVSLTQDGLALAELKQKMIRYQPKVLYLTPNNQNPTCIQYSLQQRQAIIELARQYDVIIIEDDVNYSLPVEWHTPMWCLDQASAQDEMQQKVVYLSSLSKLFCGGLRQGFLLCPLPLLAKIKQALYSQCWMVSPLNTELACKIIGNKAFMGDREQQIANRQRLCIAMGERLNLSQTWRGLNGWLQLSLPLKSHHVVAALAAEGILIRDGDDFDNRHNHIRLSIGGTCDETEFKKQLALIESTILKLSQSSYSFV